MRDTIYRDEAIEAINKSFDKETLLKCFVRKIAIDAIIQVPSTDRLQGEWIGYNADKGDDWLRSDGEPIFLVCNKCYGTVINNTSAHWNFCPNCGAKMDGYADRKEDN